MELPVAFCDEMKRILGDEYEDYLKSMEGTRKFGLRVNTAKISVEDLDVYKRQRFHRHILFRWESTM